jgi:hypothetical protein
MLCKLIVAPRHGAGNGLLPIAKGTVPLAIFGPVCYGLRSGILGAPARATRAASPLLFGLLMDHMGIRVVCHLGQPQSRADRRRRPDRICITTKARGLAASSAC